MSKRKIIIFGIVILLILSCIGLVIKQFILINSNPDSEVSKNEKGLVYQLDQDCINYVKSLGTIEYSKLKNDKYSLNIFYKDDNTRKYYICLENVKYITDSEELTLEDSFEKRVCNPTIFEQDIQNLSIVVTEDIKNNEKIQENKKQDFKDESNNLSENSNEIITKNPISNNSENISSTPKKPSESNNESKNESSKNDNDITNNKPTTPSISNNHQNSDEKITKEKVLCTESNKGWKKFYNEIIKNNPESVYYDSLNAAIEYGEYAAKKFGYAYVYDSNPQTYEDSECKKSIYSVTLYIPRGDCVDQNGSDNPQIWLPATKKENLIDTFTYLRKKGYDCGNKKWVPIS